MSPGAQKCSVCDQLFHVICGIYSEDSEGFGLKVACNLCVRKNRIKIKREGAKLVRNNKLKQWFLSPTQDFQQLTLGQTLWSGCLTLIEDVQPAEMYQQSSLMSALLGFICCARRKAYLSGCMLAMNSQLLTTTSSGHMMCPQVHYLFGQPPR